MRSILLPACVALALVLVPSAAQAQQVAPLSPFLGGARADVNELGQAVVAWAGPGGVRAVLGTRAGGFGPAAALSSGADTAAAPQVAIDAAGDAIVVWETKRTVPGSNCSTCGPRTLSAGVWAALRRAGGAFGDAVQLAGPSRDTGAEFQLDDPKLAMSSTGHAVIAWSDSDGTGAALRAPGGDIGAPQRVAPAGFPVISAAIGGSGEAFVGDRAGRVLIRPAGGAFGAPQLLPGAAPQDGHYVYVAANTAGEAFAAYYGDFDMRLSRRPAGGDWGAPALVDAPLGSGLRSAALSDSGAAAAAYIKSVDPRTGLHNVIFTALSPPAGGAPSLEAASRDDGDADTSFDGSGLDTDVAGDLALAFDRYDSQDLLFGRHVAQVAVRRAGGAWGAPVTLTPPAATGHATLDSADAAIDAGGELLATWGDHYPREMRLTARWFTSDGGAGPPIVLDSTPVRELVLPPAPAPRGHSTQIDSRFRLRAGPGGRVAVRLNCVSNDGRACKGTLTLAYGKQLRTAGRARFTVAAGGTRRVVVPLRRNARRALLRAGELTMTATARTTAPNGGTPTARAPLTISAPANAPKGTLRVTSRVLPSTAVYTEGAVQFASLYRENGAKPAFLTRRSRGGRLRFARKLVPGGYTLNSWTRTCDGNCNTLGPPSLYCSVTFRIGSGAVRRYEIDMRVGRRCRIVTRRRPTGR